MKLAAWVLIGLSATACANPGRPPAASPPAASEVTPAALPRAATIGAPEPVAFFEGPMPTGVTVSRTGRLFVSFPRWDDPVAFTVAEVVGGRAVPYPDAAINRLDAKAPGRTLVSVQSVVVDPADRLWILDTGSLDFGPPLPGGPKLVGVDLATNRVVKTIRFPGDVVLPTTYLNDVRFDLRRGTAGLAFITDSASRGPNGIIVVDLETGRSRRLLHDHPSTKPAPGFVPIVEGRPLRGLSIGSDGIAIGADGERLFYCPLAGRRLYSVSVDALADPARTPEQVAATIVDHGEKGMSDGLESDAEGRVYVSNVEHNAIHRRHPDGALETLAYDPRLLWPDTLALGHDGYLYVTVNQLHRRPSLHGGRDLRVKPYAVMRLRVDGTPVVLR